jgi:hypothetical protein
VPCIPHARPERAGHGAADPYLQIPCGADQALCSEFPLAADDPVTQICIERQTLGAAYLNAIHDVHALLATQGRALVQGDAALDRFEAPLTLARERRDHAWIALLAHVQAYGCKVRGAGMTPFRFPLANPSDSHAVVGGRNHAHADYRDFVIAKAPRRSEVVSRKTCHKAGLVFSSCLARRLSMLRHTGSGYEHGF